MSTSPFLARPTVEWVASNSLAFAIRDLYPVTPGHTLLVPRRLVATWFEATREERLAIDLLDVVKDRLEAEFRPDGYNVGFNAGTAAGQTVMHLHLHVIPRYRGDCEDPRGGVRHVIPATGTTCGSRDRGLRSRGPGRIPRQGPAHPVGGSVHGDLQVRASRVPRRPGRRTGR